VRDRDTGHPGGAVMGNLTRIDITGAAEVYYRGELIAECHPLYLLRNDDLRREVDRARALEALPHILSAAIADLERDSAIEDHINNTPTKKRQAKVDGFFDGLRRKTVPHPDPGVPPILTNSTVAYGYGYHAGEAIARAVDFVNQITKERRVTA
jgi:hypothetical protein